MSARKLERLHAHCTAVEHRLRLKSSSVENAARCRSWPETVIKSARADDDELLHAT